MLKTNFYNNGSRSYGRFIKKEDHLISIQEGMTRYADVIKQLKQLEKEEIKVIVAESEGEEESTEEESNEEESNEEEST